MGADAAAVADHRPVVAGRPQRRLGLGAGAGRPRLRRPPHRHRRALRRGDAGRASPSAARRPTASRASRSTLRVDVAPPGPRPPGGAARPRGRSSGHAGGAGAVDEAVTLVPAAPRRPRRGRARRRVGGAVRVAVVDATGARSRLPSRAARLAPVRPGAARVPLRPDDGTGDVLDRPRSDVGCPAAPAPTCPATAGASSIGARPPTPGG